MLDLAGKNLCERQKEINFKVNEAAQNNVQLRRVSFEPNTDINRIFKIDLASKYKNAEYIVEELKSGDSLAVSRALKCEWLFDSEHAHIINPDYLHHHVFPSMSMKMKKKMLSAVSINVRDEKRAQLFYEYCNNSSTQNYARKFLIFTSESFKEKVMNNNDKFYEIYREVETKYFLNLIGNSFKLADLYGQNRMSIADLTYLYSVNDVKYLDLLEKYSNCLHGCAHAGAKLSRSILKKHKQRVLNNPLLYLKFLNEKELVKYSTAEDAIVYLNGLLPKDAKEFWQTNFFIKYKHIFHLIKLEGSMYKFVKTMFKGKYPTDEFEMSKDFYNLRYYDLMTYEEQEAWAVNHLENQTGVIPENQDYKWYAFMNFEKCFAEIKKRILITSDQKKRSELLSVLSKSAKSQGDLKKLLDYYYNRHVNEPKKIKESFLQGIIDHHKVFQFDDSCWEALHKIFYSLELYTSPESNIQFLVVSLIYHIIHEKPLPNSLVVENINRYTVKDYLRRLSDIEKDLVYTFFFNFTATKLTEFDSREYDDETKRKVRLYIYTLEFYMQCLAKEKKYPDIAIKFMKLDTQQFGYLFRDKSKQKIDITEGYLLRCLKKNPSDILEMLLYIKEKCDDSREFRINLFLKKMKTYFSNDIAKHYLDFCIETLSENNDKGLLPTIYAIFQLGDKKTILDMMDKYAPTNPKIEYDTIDGHVYHVQKAICRMHCYSRPPVPLTKTALYIKGDYVHECDEMFSMYLANLPPGLLTSFIQLLLDSPVSLQKRGLRLAFQAFDSNDLKNLVLSIWKKTKNVSLRSVIYESFLGKVAKESGKPRDDLFEVLKELTLTIHEDDDGSIFDCFNGYELPENLKGAYLQTAWETVVALSEKKSANNQHKSSVIKALTSKISLIDDEFLLSIINDHVHRLLSQQKLRPETNTSIEDLNKAKWYLVAQYIVENSTKSKLEKSLNILKSIVDECFNNWNVEHGSGIYVFQEFFKMFVSTLDNRTSYFGKEYLKVVHVHEYLLNRFENKFDISEMYSYLWDFKLSIMTRKVIDGKSKMDKQHYINYGLRLGLLVKEMKETNRFYKYFVGKIVEKITEFIQDLCYVKESGLVNDDVFILVAYGLTLTAEDDNFILALEILPNDLSVRPAIQFELPEVIKKIKQQNNTELNAFMKDKFIYTDHKVRELLK